MKNLNPLRTLRLLTALSAASSPVYVPLFVGLAASMVSTSTAEAQGPSGGTLPPLPPATGSASNPTAQLAADSMAFAKELLGKAQAALNEGRREVAIQTLAQAHLVGPSSPEWTAESQKMRQYFQDKGVAPTTIENAIKVAQASVSKGANSSPVNVPATLPLPGTTANNAAPTPTPLPSLPGLPPTRSPLAQSPAAQSPTAQPLPSGGTNAARDQAASLAAQAKLALEKGDIKQARQWIDQANQLKVPDREFAPGQTKPWEVDLAVRSKEMLQSGVVAASASMPINGNSVQPAGGSTTSPVANGQPNGVESGVFQPQKDTSKVAPASGVLTSYDADATGRELYQQGISALTAGNKEAAMEKFKAAWQKKNELDPPTLAQLKDKLALLSSEPRSSGSPESVAALSAESKEAQVKRQRLFSEVTGEIADAERLAMGNKPMEALDKLRSLRQRITQADSDANYRKSMLSMVDRVSANIEAWVDQNKVAIELDQRNNQLEDRMRLEAANRAETDARIQTLVDQYNQLIESRRFQEAIEVAKKVDALRPGSEIASVMINKATIQARNDEYELIRNMKSEGFSREMLNTDIAAVPTDDNKPFSFPSAVEWSQLTKRRLRQGDDARISPMEKKIRETLSESFSATFDKRPLSDAMKTISEMFGIPIDIDERSIQEEGITIDQPISLDLQGNPIALKSALSLILEKLNLTYSVKYDVLTIQSKRFNQKELRTEVYSVKDLVIPIPNFVSDYNTGMAGALNSAYQAQTSFASARIEPKTAVSATQVASIDPKSPIMAQMASMPVLNGLSPSLASALPGSMLMSQSANSALGGGAMADYSNLMNLIQTTIQPDTWQMAGGTSTMQPFSQNLTLVVSAPQEVHEAIADLLKSLRALQNLQVTIEVRFIQLQDTFFERIGVDFDMKYDDNVRQLPRDDSGPSVAVGLSSGLPVTGVPSFTSDLDLQLNNNFTVNPPFGNPDINQATSFGVAILSDLELFFFLQASQGNSRQNVLNAPKVTMFDGQFASINDFASRPFVTGFTPVVGDFAVAQQPIVVVLNEGTQMNVQSVVSQDRRFVRMTLLPQFTRIENADRTFTFTGRRVSRTGTSILNPNGTPSGSRNNEEDIIEGTTVQQPTLGQTSISTVVSVPDGGTILLGGIKRLREGRVERGTPILSKIPYLNRLFKNDAIGRETSTLMMTVTPRIIIPEEEEELLGYVAPNQP